MKYKQPRRGFELGSLGPFHTTLSITPRMPPKSSDGLVSYPGHSLGEEDLTPQQRCSQCILPDWAETTKIEITSVIEK